jgi:lysophospholipase L1-like esterase
MNRRSQNAVRSTGLGLLFFCFCFSHDAIAQTVTWDSTYRPAIYQARAGQFKSFKQSKNDIIFLGNSITAYGNWDELFDNRNVRNRGIPGDITFGLLARLNDVVIGKPSKIFLLIGINDIGRNIPDDVILKNYERIVQQIKRGSPKTKIYFQTLLPVNSTVLPALPHFNKEEHILAVNEGLKKMALKENITLIDLYPLFLDSENRLDKDYCFDGLHLNDKGYLKWAEFIKTKGYLKD